MEIIGKDGNPMELNPSQSAMLRRQWTGPDEMTMGEGEDEMMMGEKDKPAEVTFREKVVKIADGKISQTIMTLLTFFALYGDDLRTYAFYAKDDAAFYVLYIITFLAFAAELTTFSIAKEGYKWSFFFWLDMIATLSLTIDVKWYNI